MFRINTLLLLFGVLLCSPITVCAQESAPEKDVVVVDMFARNRVVPMIYLEAVRQQVLAAFTDRGRHIVVDVATSDVALPSMGRGFVDTQTAMAIQNRFIQDRMEAMHDAGARYVVTGAITDYKFEHIDIPAGDEKPPVAGFRSTFQVVLSAYDMKLNKQIPERICVIKGEAHKAEDADKKAISTLRGQLIFYVDYNFKFETTILQLGAASARKGVQELYIHCGTEMGVRDGDLFLVYEEVLIGGIPTRQKIGKIRVNNVENPDVAKCKISKGNTQIIDAFAAGRKLICISDGQAMF